MKLGWFTIEQNLRMFPMWKIAHIEIGEPKSLEASTLLQAEARSYGLEDIFRHIARSNDEYSLCRSHTFCLRARSLYLRDQYREAHRVLTLASCDLSEHLASHQFALAVIAVHRAELMRLSADEQFRRDGNAVKAAMRKLDTALLNLDNAVNWLKGCAHRPLWWLRALFGRAMVRHDQLVMESQRWSVEPSRDPIIYNQRHTWLEECVLDGLNSLRLALDALPFEPRKKRPKPAATNSSILIAREVTLLETWLKLFVASYTANRSLILSTGHLTDDCEEVLSRRAERIIRAGKLLGIPGFWSERWNPWCQLGHFHRFSERLQEPITKNRAANSFAAVLKDIDNFENSLCQATTLLDTMWEIRRDE
jgi:hypothetical protein